MITLKPTSLYFIYTGVELAKQNVSVLQSPPQFYDNPGYKIQVRYQQNVAPWLLIQNISEDIITNVVQEGMASRFFCKYDSSINLSDGNYSAEVYVAIGNITAPNVLMPDEDNFMMVYLNVKAGNIEFTVTPSSAVLHVVKSSSVDPKINLSFTANSNFTAEGNAHLTLDLNNLPQELTPSSTPELSISATARTLPYGVHQSPIQFKNGNQHLGTLPVKLLVTETDGLEVFPKTLYFEEIKGVDLASEQLITVYDPEDNCSLTCPTWMTYQLVSNEDNFKVYAINVISDTLAPQVFSGTIDITDGINSAVVNVTYKLIGLYNYEYEKPYHFTQDAEYLEFIKSQLNKNTFLRLQLNIKIYQFNGQIDEYNRTQDLFFFQNKVSFDAGAFIHNIFKNYEGENKRYQNLASTIESVPQYQFATILFSVSEIDFDTKESYSTFVIPEQHYALGRDPRPKFLNKILSHRTNQITRVTAKSIISFNYLRYSNSLIKILKNGQPISFRLIMSESFLDGTIPQASDVRIYGGLLNLSHVSNLQTNDLIEIHFDNQVLRYIVEEDGINSVNCFYVDQFGLLSSFELTGEFDIDTGYERITTPTFKDWIEKTKTLSTDKLQNLKINSGYISPENIRILDEINLAKKVFLLIDSQLIEARPITSKLNNQTTSDSLHNRVLEFELINKTYDHFHAF